MLQGEARQFQEEGVKVKMPAPSCPMLSRVSGKASIPKSARLVQLSWSDLAEYRGCGRHIPWSSLPGEQPSLGKPLETFLKRKMSLWEGPGEHHAPSTDECYTLHTQKRQAADQLTAHPDLGPG